MAKRLSITCLVLAFFVVAALAQSVLNNDSIIKMAGANLGDDVIVSMVKSQPANYTVDTDSIILLKKDGVSDKVIAAMIERNSDGGARIVPVSMTPSAAPLVDEVGIYYRNKDNKWTEILPEVVNWKTGGFMKTLATDGLVKGDINGHIQGKISKTSLDIPLDFLIYMPEGTAVTEYQLLHLHESGNSREFRSTTGGIIHASGGAQRDEVAFDGKKIAPRMYEIVLGVGVKAGDYGFLPPGAMSSSNMASAGKVYTFHVIE